ncbi:hypothetical protein BP6252_10619 [Coleophoma cylindrospora]|uniref:Uncharacterized protein n=1 Tax=Coleophoma cylindrospora TaxID=1849047 RepID=A0A3D8QTF4_9HELO|nr:hypothetical protein BP6252_10619 [Coleophoma cylindrospora]
MPFGSNTICFQTPTRKRVRSISTSTTPSTHPSRSPIKKPRSTKSTSSTQPHLGEPRTTTTSHATRSHSQRKLNQVLSTILSEEEDANTDAASQMDICDGFDSLCLNEASPPRNPAPLDAPEILSLEAGDEWDRWSKVPFTGAEAQPAAFLQRGDGGVLSSGLSSPQLYENGRVFHSSPSCGPAGRRVFSTDSVWNLGAPAAAASEKDYVDWEASLGCAAGDFPG